MSTRARITAILVGVVLLAIPEAGVFLAIAWALVVLWWRSRLRSARPDVAPPGADPGGGPVAGVTFDGSPVDLPAPRPKQRRSRRGGAYQPPPPSGEPWEPWSPRHKSIEVAGESHYQEQIAQLFAGAGSLSAEGSELHLHAFLVPAPDNPHDKHAIAVYVLGFHVGYLPRAEARRYQPVVSAAAARGDLVTVESRQWARTDGGRLYARVTLHLPDPSGFEPVNGLPTAAHVDLPTGSTIQVTREDEHMDALRPIVASYGTDQCLAATLHAVTEERPRSTVDLVEVRIDQSRVGVLSPTQTANLLPLVRMVDTAGKLPVARAFVRGNDLKAEVTLQVAKAADVPREWIEAVSCRD